MILGTILGTELISLSDSSATRPPLRIAGMRRPRQIQEGATYHVTARINRKEMLLDPAATKELFLTVLKRAKKKFSFHIENFCIMGNHFHLMITPSAGEKLSSIMQWIMSVFAMAYNRIHGLSGHVWGQRFFSRIIANFHEFIEICRYIDENPVRSQLVRDKFHWPFGGLWHQRTGCFEIVDPAPAWLLDEFPERHIQEYQYCHY